MTTSTISRSAWVRTTARQRALRALTDSVETDPTSLQDAVRRARTETFGSLDALLLELHTQWVRTFDASLDELMEHGAYGDRHAVDERWAETTRALEGAARVLDAYSDHPVVVQAHAQHAQRVRRTLATGLPAGWSLPTPAARGSRRTSWRRCALALLPR